MAETWKQWEGTIVDGKFRLERFLGGSDHSAVFLTETGTPPAKAAIKFVPAIPQALDFHRSTWEQTSRLSHPNLIRVFGGGQCRLGYVDLLYVVMEYAEENLAQILPDRALRFAVLARLGCRVIRRYLPPQNWPRRAQRLPPMFGRSARPW